FIVPGTPDHSRPKTVFENVELDVRIRSFAIPILAVDDLGFCRMQLQAALCQARLKFGLEGLGFLLVPAVNQSIIRIPTPRKVRVRPGPLQNARLLEPFAMVWTDQAMKRGRGRNFAFALVNMR